MRASHFADVAQLVERNLAKVEVAGSKPAVRSTFGCAPVEPPGAAEGTARRDVHVDRIHVCSEGTQFADIRRRTARAWTQPKVEIEICPCSSVGSSARLVSERSSVRIVTWGTKVNRACFPILRVVIAGHDAPELRS